MHRFSYGLVTLAFLWACGGADLEIFWGRILIAALLIVVISLATVFVEKKKQIFHKHSASIMMGASPAILIGALSCGYLAATEGGQAASQILSPPSFFGGAAFLVIILSHEILFRGILQPLWGLWSVAFLEAVNIGFGLNSLPLFFIFLLTGVCAGYLSRRFGFVSALIFRGLCTLIILLCSGMLDA